MPALVSAIDNLTLTITQEMLVRASLEKTFDSLLEQLGPANEGMNGVPMPMTLEARPGGRWFRDLGGNDGHLWGLVQAIKRHAPNTAIVMVNTSDPVGNGLVESLAQPGGSITGITNLSPEISAKRLELLKESVPGLARVAYLWNSGLAGASDVHAELQAAARRLKLELRSVEARRVEDIAPALATIGRGPATALLVQAPNPVLYTERRRIAELARAQGLPSMFNRWEYVSAGGLMSYGPNVPDMYRRAAGYIDQIFKGARPGEIPVERPSQFELAINLQTAQALGIAVPRAVLGRADRTF